MTLPPTKSHLFSERMALPSPVHSPSLSQHVLGGLLVALVSQYSVFPADHSFFLQTGSLSLVVVTVCVGQKYIVSLGQGWGRFVFSHYVPILLGDFSEFPGRAHKGLWNSLLPQIHKHSASACVGNLTRYSLSQVNPHFSIEDMYAQNLGNYFNNS